MKNSLSILLIFITCFCYGQLTAIPDDNFELYLETHDINGFTVPVGDSQSMGNGVVGDNLVSTNKINSAIELSPGPNISDVTGINEFTSLEYLYLYNNQITNLSISIPSLGVLGVSNNNMETLDISGCTNLWALVANNNNLSSIDLSNNTALQEVFFNNNVITGDVDLSNNGGLLYFEIKDNLIETIDLRNRDSSSIPFEFDATQNPNLTCVFVDDTNNIPIGWVIDNTANFGLDEEDCANTVEPEPIVNIPDANLKNTLVNENSADLGDGVWQDVDTNNDGDIQVSEAEAVLKLKINAEGIADFEGVQYFVNLEELNCGSNSGAGIDVITQNLNLKTLTCGSMGLTTINLNLMSNLEKLDIGFNPLTSLDLTQNPNLEDLYIGGCYPLASLDVTQNPNLRILNFRFNYITNIDLSQNLLLEELYCEQNFLLNLDLTQLEFLKTLICFSSGLLSLDVTQNLNLEYLDCRLNELTNLDVSQNLNLTDLICDNNQLINIDVPQNNSLEVIRIKGNQLTSIDVSQSPQLRQIICNNNQINSLDLSTNTGLRRVECNDNLPLSSLNLQNGNFLNFLSMKAQNNPNLNCIQVDDVDYAIDQQNCYSGAPNYSWCVDDINIYSTNCNLSLQEFSFQEVSIYPNPAEDILNVDHLDSVDSICVYSIDGSLIKKVESKTSIVVSDLSSGLYFVKISSGVRSVIKKFVKF